MCPREPLSALPRSKRLTLLLYILTHLYQDRKIFLLSTLLHTKHKILPNI